MNKKNVFSILIISNQTKLNSHIDKMCPFKKMFIGHVLSLPRVSFALNIEKYEIRYCRK